MASTANHAVLIRIPVFYRPVLTVAGKAKRVQAAKACSNPTQMCSLWQEKREKVEAAKLPVERRAIPLAPAELEGDLPTSAADIDAFNARMFDYYNNR